MQGCFLTDTSKVCFGYFGSKNKRTQNLLQLSQDSRSIAYSPPNPPTPFSFPFHFLLALSVGADVGQLGHWRFDLTPRPSQAVETRTTCVSILHGSLDRQVVKTEIEFRVEKMQRNPIIAPPRSRPMEVFAILAEIRTSQRPSIIMQLQIVLCKLTTEVIQLTM
jgi:hypothetical protein